MNTARKIHKRNENIKNKVISIITISFIIFAVFATGQSDYEAQAINISSHK